MEIKIKKELQKYITPEIEREAGKLLFQAGISRETIEIAAERLVGDTIQTVFQDQQDKYLVFIGNGIIRMNQEEYDKFIENTINNLPDDISEEDKEGYINFITIQKFSFDKLNDAENKIEELLIQAKEIDKKKKEEDKMKKEENKEEKENDTRK